MREFNTLWREYLVAAGDRPSWRWKVNPHARNQIIVREQVVSASPDISITDLAQLMEEENVGSVVIVEEEQPQGLVTDRDIMIEVVAHDQDSASMTAADVMSEDLLTVDIESGIFEVLRTIGSSHRSRALT